MLNARAGALRLLALVPYGLDRVPGQRFRIEQWVPGLEAEGIEVTLSPFLSDAVTARLHAPGRSAWKAGGVLRGYLRRLADVRRLDRFDVVYVFREAAFFGPAWLDRAIARHRPVVFDFDDAIYLQAAGGDPRLRMLRATGKAADICRVARSVTAGNETLAAFARRHAERVEVIPTSIDTDAYRVVERAPGPRPVVGWTGSATTAPYLAALAEPLRRLAGVQDFELRVIGASVEMPGVDVRCLPWRASTEAGDIRAFDAGLMPLPDDEWARGKCGLKALQYMALGVPPVVSPVGVNAAIVRDGVNGFHARDDRDWCDRLAALLRDPGLRARMGAEGRRTVEETYSARVQAPRMAAVLRDAHERAARARHGAAAGRAGVGWA